jgi:hypothetical protein
MLHPGGAVGQTLQQLQHSKQQQQLTLLSTHRVTSTANVGG